MEDDTYMTKNGYIYSERWVSRLLWMLVTQVDSQLDDTEATIHIKPVHNAVARIMMDCTISPSLFITGVSCQTAMSCVEGVEKEIDKHFCRWLGIPTNIASIGLYIRSSQLQLPLSSVMEVFKVEKCKVMLTFRDSQDNQVRDTGTIRSKRKWAVSASVAQAENMIKLQKNRNKGDVSHYPG